MLWRRGLSAVTGNCAIPGGYGIVGSPAIDKAAGPPLRRSGTPATCAPSASPTAATPPPRWPSSPRPGTNKVWGGLNLNGGDLYVATASDGCDSPPWRGQVIRVDVSGAAPRVAGPWDVVAGIPAPNGGGGIWGYGGVAVDPATGHVYATPGADSTEGYAAYADRIVGLTRGPGRARLLRAGPPDQRPLHRRALRRGLRRDAHRLHPDRLPDDARGRQQGREPLPHRRRRPWRPAERPARSSRSTRRTTGWARAASAACPPTGRTAGCSSSPTRGPAWPASRAASSGLHVKADCSLEVAWSHALGGATQPELDADGRQRRRRRRGGERRAGARLRRDLRARAVGGRPGRWRDLRGPDRRRRPDLRGVLGRVRRRRRRHRPGLPPRHAAAAPAARDDAPGLRGRAGPGRQQRARRGRGLPGHRGGVGRAEQPAALPRRAPRRRRRSSPASTPTRAATRASWSRRARSPRRPRAPGRPSR